MTQINCGEAIVRLLADYGINTVFGIPGVHTIEMYRNLESTGISHILTRHEQGAGFMADGFARASGKPAACFLISGPGLTNAATPIAQAYSDSVPMVVIATTNLRSEIGKGWGPFHELRNQRLIAEQFCAYAGQALSPSDIPDIMAMAFAAMQSGRPRPVYIEIPRDILSEPATGDWTPRFPAPRPAPHPKGLKAAADILASAERPLLLVGAGASDASVEITKLTERLDATVISSFCGKGIVDEAHDNVLGACLSMPEARALVSKADAVLAIGTEISTVDASNNTLEFNGKLIRVDVDPRKMTDRYATDVALIADAKLAAQALLDALPPVDKINAKSAWAKARDVAKAALDRFGAPRSKEHRAILDVIKSAVPADAILVGDMTQLAYTGNHFYETNYPRQWLHPASFATLGYALPTAIGAQISCPDRAVVSIAGDCGFQFTCQELATAAEQRLPIVQILWNNEALGEIRDAMIGAQIAPVEVNGLNPDFAALAQSYHWKAERAGSLVELQEMIATALTGDGPTLIEVREGAGDWAI